MVGAYPTTLLSAASPINDCETLPKLLLLDTERRVGEESVPPHERVESLLARLSIAHSFHSMKRFPSGVQK